LHCYLQPKKHIRLRLRVLPNKADNQTIISLIFYQRKEVAVLVAVTEFSFLVESDYVNKTTTYKNARLIIPNADAGDKRWYILFYVYDKQQNKTIRKRDFSCNKIADIKKRNDYCKKFITQLDAKLQDGYIIDSEKSAIRNTKTKATNNEQITLMEAMNLALKHKEKLRAKTHYNYTTYVNGFYKFIPGTVNLLSINAKTCKRFVASLEDNKLGIRTINNYVTHLSSLWAWLIAEEIISINPWTEIERPKNPRGKNIAYSPEQQKKLINYMDINCPELALFCKTMYYTLARPNELCNLQIKHIDLYRPKHLYIPAEISKNGIERHVALPPPIYQLLKPLKTQKPDFYIFGKGIKPNHEPMPARYVSASYKERVLDKLKLPSEYTMYSWKHTGVVTNYLAGMSSGALRMQIGHADTGSFETYLQTVGMFNNDEVMNNYKELPK
jgi:integrase